jgi:hypothetical protein
LQNKGYEQYLPVYRRRQRWSDRILETDRRLFRGYVFCRFDARKRLPIVSTPAVVSVVGFGNEPALSPTLKSTQCGLFRDPASVPSLARFCVKASVFACGAAPWKGW